MGIQVQSVFGRKIKGLALALMAMGLSACGQSNSDAKEASAEADKGEVVVFSARKQHLIEPLFNEFTKETGIKVNFITDSPQPLLARGAPGIDRRACPAPQAGASRCRGASSADTSGVPPSA